MAGVKNKRTIGRHHGRAHWTREQQSMLLELGMHGYIPEQARAAATTRWQRLSATRRARQFGEALQDLRYFCSLANLPVFQWEHPVWRDCIEIRYRWRDKAPIDVLERRLKEKLDGIVDRITSQRRSELRVPSRWPKLPPCIRRIIPEYVRARLLVELSPDHPLCQPMSASGFIELLKWGNPMLEGLDLERYVTVSAAEPQSIVGEVIYYLHACENHFRGRTDQDLPGNMATEYSQAWQRSRASVPSADYHAIAKLYVHHLGIGVSAFRLIAEVYRYFGAQASDPRHNTIQLVATILEHTHPDVFSALVAQIRGFRDSVLQPFIRSGGNPSNLDRHWLDELYPFRIALAHDPLLSCVLLSELFRNGEGVEDKRRGHPSMLREGLTSAFAVRLLQEHKQGNRWPPVRQVLSEFEAENSIVGREIPSGENNGIYAYLSPLLTALFGFQRTQSQVKELADQYKSHYELDGVWLELILLDLA